MAVKKTKTEEVSMKNTKQELLDAYDQLLKEVENRQAGALKPEQKVEEKKKKEVLKAVEEFSTDGITGNINNLKLDIGKMLGGLSEKLDSEAEKYNKVKEAIRIKEMELKDIYDIEKTASSLAALIEAQHRIEENHKQEMTASKEELENEIGRTRAEWKTERERHIEEKKERLAAELKKREREKEEYIYSFKREKQLEKNKFEDEKKKLESEKKSIKDEISEMKARAEKELAEREKAVAGKEEELAELRSKAAGFPDELTTALDKAVKEISEKLKLESDFNERLLKQQFEGEKNVLKTRIQSLEKTAAEYSDQLNKLAEHQEAAYQKVQDVAVKAIEGASKTHSLGGLQHLFAEERKKKLDNEK